jgi:hypothetical protein
MSTQKIARILGIAVLLVAAFAALTPTFGVAPVSAAARKGAIHVTKNCVGYVGAAGQFCTITSSNIAEITPGSQVFYQDAANSPAGMLDTNVVLVAAPGHWAVGRCTLDLATFRGVCTFSDGNGQLAGFHARVNVSWLGGDDFSWDGTYSFRPKVD